ncbi:DinB family protein [Marixanthomonas spongiae]|uniref:DinB family protein n=1 Tax=Marixanthomonas spongiae TaxID=2174845 RepID=A0A2U0HXK5_9FLAO|nr:DinB family protein [Marixanthomonas spongiae]PVW13558.1 hypothetical protein DDV96_12950 [Marixanthomonas spongiae]
MINEQTIRSLLKKHLAGGEAFIPLEELLSEITFERIGERPYNLPYSFYELFYHIAFAQKDILKFCVSEDYTAPNWPDAYWPDKQRPKTESEWKQLKQEYLDDRKQLQDLAETASLTETVPTGDGQTLMRELLLVIEHTAYHTGQLVVVLRLLGLKGS